MHLLKIYECRKVLIEGDWYCANITKSEVELAVSFYRLSHSGEGFFWQALLQPEKSSNSGNNRGNYDGDF